MRCPLLSIVIVGLLLVPHTAAKTLYIDGSTGTKPLIEALASDYRKTNPDTDLMIGKGLTPTERISALLDQKIDIAMASHGVDFESFTALGLNVHRIASIAVVFGVNHNVDIISINRKQLCDIYTQHTTDWGQLGSSGDIIRPFVRPFTEVDAEVVAAYLPCISSELLTENIQVKHKSGQMAFALAGTPGAIGMTNMVRVTQSQQQIRALALDGISPTSHNLANGTYTLSRDVYLITRTDSDDTVAAFISFIRSAAGQSVMKANNAAPAI